MRHAGPLALLLALLAAPTAAETLRVATWNASLECAGPGLLLHELTTKPSAQAQAVVQVIQAARPDILLLVRIDHDLHGRALDALVARLAEGPNGISYPYRFDAAVNAGTPSGFDLNDDGRTRQPEDAFGWGRFPGHGGMAILSRLPIDAATARTFTTLPWTRLPGADLPTHPGGTPFPDAERQALLRLSSRAHWDVPIRLPDGTLLHLLASNPTPPLHDGPERFNQRRNRDEIRFWSAYLDGTPLPDDQGHTAPAPDAPLVVLGDLNLDPADGRGAHGAIAALLANPHLQDPAPASPGAAAAWDTGVNARHTGPAALDTADWSDESGPGNLRLDYVLPSAGLPVAGAGVFWPAPGDPMADSAAAASPHRLVWVDLTLP